MLIGAGNRQRNNNKRKMGQFIELGRKMGYWARGFDFPQLGKQVFGNEILEGKNMLELGCGKGLFCIWASIHGANHVVGLEPLVEGSFDQKKIFDNFRRFNRSLQLHNIEMLPLKIQEFEAPEDHFDIVLSVASVNHLDEQACIAINKRRDEKAISRYLKIFNRIKRLVKDGGKIIILDCSSRNFFGDRSIKNPFGKQVQWFKHLEPETWAELLQQSGFREPKITWPSGRYLRYLRIFNRPRLVSYFIDSYFRLEMTCFK